MKKIKNKKTYLAKTMDNGGLEKIYWNLVLGYFYNAIQVQSFFSSSQNTMGAQEGERVRRLLTYMWLWLLEYADPTLEWRVTAIKCLKHLFAISLCNKHLWNVYYVPDNVVSTEDTDTMKEFEKLMAEEKKLVSIITLICCEHQDKYKFLI